MIGEDLEDYIGEVGLKPLTARLEEDAEPLWGDRRGERLPYTLQKESARHRVIIELKACGRHTNKEIAEMVGMSSVTVCYILRQSWAEKMLVELARKQGASEREAVYKLLDGVCLEAVEKQIDIMRSSENDDTVRKVTNDLLNRTYGTPTATVKTVQGEDINKLSDAEIAVRLAELRASRRSN